MTLYETIHPKEMIRGIPQMRSRGQVLSDQEMELIKEKLLLAEERPDIIRLARGEGRRNIIKEIVKNDSVLFDWGMKSQHAFNDSSKYRDFLEPNNVDPEQMKRLLQKCRKALTYRLKKHFPNSNQNVSSMERIIDSVVNGIDQNSFSSEQLYLIKDWLCSVLHTAGDVDFKNISPWVSTSQGSTRYKEAYYFGQRGIKNPPSNKKCVRNRFVIFDTWVGIYEDHYVFERTDHLIQRLYSMGLPWYNDTHHEIMLKYAIYPHRLAGYFFIENDKLLYYYVNHHYLDLWRDDPNFQIGDYVYIDQSEVQFPANNPYKMIYSRFGNCFEIFDRR